MDKTFVAQDQYGHTYLVRGRTPRQALLNHFGRKHANLMYQDNPLTKTTSHIGWVIATLWLKVGEVKWMDQKLK